MRLTQAEAQSRLRQYLEDPDAVVHIILSGRLSGTSPEYSRVDIRPVLIRGVLNFQFTLAAADALAPQTRNLLPSETSEYLGELLDMGYSNYTARTTQVMWQCRITKRRVAMVHSELRDSSQNLEHDRTKPRLLDPADPLLVAVGISSSAGKVKPSRFDKYRQIEEFLRIFAATVLKAVEQGHLPAPTPERPLRIVDLGCGHAYLTFAVQAWAERIQGWPVHIVGIDRRESSVVRNRDLVRQLGITGMEFLAAEIDQAPAFAHDAVDVVLALHACDTATDDALAWAIRREAKAILAAPCCHHDLQRQFSDAPTPYALVTRYNFLSEKFIDTLTDAIRATVLRQQGFRVDVIEFVGGEHTPRNTMIRAIHTGADAGTRVADELDELLESWEFSPAIIERLSRS